MDDFVKWELRLRAAERELVPGTILKLQRALVFLTLGAAVQLSPGRYRRISGVVLLTPVDTGRARASWNVSVGNPDRRVPGPGTYRTFASPRYAQEKARAALVSLGPYQTVWITSSLEYVPVLEFGGYPNPVERGSWDKQRRRYVVRSQGGYSRQAPRGMVGVTWAAMRQALTAA